MPPRDLLDEQQADLDAAQADREVDQVLGVLRDRAGAQQVVAGDGGVGDPPVQVGLEAGRASRPSSSAGPACSARRAAGRSRRSRRPASTSSAAVRRSRAACSECRNQPVSIAIAVSRPVATSGVIVPPRALDGAHDQGPGRLGRRVLEVDRPEVVLADVVVDDHLRSREAADVTGHVAELAPGREVEDDRRPRDPPGPPADDCRPEMLEERPVRVEEVVSGRRRAGVDDADVLPLLPEQARHADLRPQGIAVGPDVRRDQEAVVGLDQVGQRGPVDAHARSRSLVGKSPGLCMTSAYRAMHPARQFRSHRRRPGTGEVLADPGDRLVEPAFERIAGLPAPEPCGQRRAGEEPLDFAGGRPDALLVRLDADRSPEPRPIVSTSSPIEMSSPRPMLTARPNAASQPAIATKPSDRILDISQVAPRVETPELDRPAATGPG